MDCWIISCQSPGNVYFPESSPAKESPSEEEHQPQRLPKPKHLEQQRRKSSEDKAETPNTKTQREIDEIKLKIEKAKMEIEKQHEENQDSFTMEMDTNDQPRLCSTQITGN